MIEPHSCARNRKGPRRLGKIDNLQSFVVGDKSVTELNCDATRVSQKAVRQFAGDARVRRVRNIDNVKSARCCQVKTMSSRGDKCRAGQRSVRIKANGLAFFQEIIVGISVDERGDIANHQSFFTVGDVNERVEQIDRLLFVFGKMLARGIERQRAGQGKARCILGLNARALTERRHWGADDPFRKSLLVDVGDVEHFETAGTVRGVKIFAAQNDVLNVVAAMFVAFSQQRAAIEMFFVVRRVGDGMEMTTDDGLRFVRLSPNHTVQTFAAFADVSVAPKEIHRAGAEA